MVMANKKMKERVEGLLNEIIANEKVADDFKAAAKEWIAGKDDVEASKAAAAKLKPFFEEGAAAGCDVCKELKTCNKRFAD